MKTEDIQGIILRELENFEDSDRVIRDVPSIALASAIANALEELEVDA